MDGPIFAGGGDGGAIGRPRQAIHVIGMTYVGEEPLAGTRIPDLHRRIKTRGGDVEAVGRPLDAGHQVVVVFIGEEEFTRSGIRDLYGIFISCRGDMPSGDHVTLEIAPAGP